MRSGVDHTVLPTNTPHLPLPYSLPEGATTERTVIALADEADDIYIYRPCEDKRLSWPCWLTYSRRFTHINGYPSAAGPVQTSESSPVRDWRSTTEPSNQRNLHGGDSGKTVVQTKADITPRNLHSPTVSFPWQPEETARCLGRRDVADSSCT